MTRAPGKCKRKIINFLIIINHVLAHCLQKRKRSVCSFHFLPTATLSVHLTYIAGANVFTHRSFVPRPLRQASAGVRRQSANMYTTQFAAAAAVSRYTHIPSPFWVGGESSRPLSPQWHSPPHYFRIGHGLINRFAPPLPPPLLLPAMGNTRHGRGAGFDISTTVNLALAYNTDKSLVELVAFSAFAQNSVEFHTSSPQTHRHSHPPSSVVSSGGGRGYHVTNCSPAVTALEGGGGERERGK